MIDKQAWCEKNKKTISLNMEVYGFEKNYFSKPQLKAVWNNLLGKISC